ncbi:hypothetical protein QIS74_01998 [Colletotrichum tabaci]|uniref:Uncharacterized protein n=1 Tax=Colletotrichum tabaci TaxID=1209068 RepID=A0AAV9TUC9_9PEZI
MSQNEVFDAESRFAGLTLVTHTALNPDDEAFFNLSDEELLARSAAICKEEAKKEEETKKKEEEANKKEEEEAEKMKEEEEVKKMKEEKDREAKKRLHPLFDLFPDWPRWPGLAPGIDQEDWSIWRDEEVGTEGRLRRLKLERRRSEEYFAWLAQFDCCAGCAEDAAVKFVSLYKRPPYHERDASI